MAAKTMVISNISCRLTEKICMLVNCFQDTGQNQKKRQSTSNLSEKEREAKVENAHKKAENAKKGSLASKANMVKKFNEND